MKIAFSFPAKNRGRLITWFVKLENTNLVLKSLSERRLNPVAKQLKPQGHGRHLLSV